MKVPKKILLLILFHLLHIIDSFSFIGQYLSYLSSPFIQEIAKRKNISLPLILENNYYNDSREE